MLHHDREIFPYVNLSGLLIERTLRYHNEHQGLNCIGCVHQLKHRLELRLEIAVTGELPPQRLGSAPSRAAETVTILPA